MVSSVCVGQSNILAGVLFQTMHQELAAVRVFDLSQNLADFDAHRIIRFFFQPHPQGFDGLGGVQLTCNLQDGQLHLLAGLFFQTFRQPGPCGRIAQGHQHLTGSQPVTILWVCGQINSENINGLFTH